MIALIKILTKTLMLALLAMTPMVLLMPGTANAGDAAEFRSHGFSSDKMGRYFAFEEFGTQDGSGFPYSNIYIVDLKQDKWAPNTPIRVLLQNDQQTELDARIKAFEQATPLMQQYNITRSGVMLAASPINEATEKYKLEFRQLINPLLGDQPKSYLLELGSDDLPDSNNCGFPDNRVLGMYLNLTKPDGTFMELHGDSNVPKSRGCPVRYDLVAVFAPSRYKELTYAVALIGVYRQGFEGPDLRYLAVPFTF